jgi:hypothetical protein
MRSKRQERATNKHGRVKMDYEGNLKELCGETAENLGIIMRQKVLNLTNEEFKVFMKVANQCEFFYRKSGGENDE